MEKVNVELTPREVTLVAGGVLLMMLKNRKQDPDQSEQELGLAGLEVLRKLAIKCEECVSPCETFDVTSNALEFAEDLVGGGMYETLDGVQKASSSQVM